MSETYSLISPLAFPSLRFSFGKNWSKYLNSLTEYKITEAAESLKKKLATDSLKGQTFLDVGSGSGLFSLAAKQLGASVRSFDYDRDSVACTRTLKERFFTNDSEWTVEEGSILDPEYLKKLPQFDVVYSWGVLHHTGQMWQAMENVTSLIKPGGKLFIAIYNDQGLSSRVWWHIKQFYNRLPSFLRFIILIPAAIILKVPPILRDSVKLAPFRSLRNYKSLRGMSPWTDLVDWVGGFPFEVAKPEMVFEFCKARNLILDNLETVGGKMGCNQFVFHKQK